MLGTLFIATVSFIWLFSAVLMLNGANPPALVTVYVLTMCTLLFALCVASVRFPL